MIRTLEQNTVFILRLDNSGSEIEITERNRAQCFSIQVDLGCASWLCSTVKEALIRGKEGGFRRFYRGSSYRIILECSSGVCFSRMGEV